MGETSTTAYAGNKGKANAEAIEALQTSVVHKTDAETISGYKTFSSGLNSSSNIQIDNSDGEYLSISGSTLFRGNGSGPDSYIDIPRNKGTSSAHATLAITDDIPAISLTTTAGSEAVTVDSSALNVVTRDTTQNITAKKTFTSTPGDFLSITIDGTKTSGGEISLHAGGAETTSFTYNKISRSNPGGSWVINLPSSGGTLALTSDIETISGAENFVQIGTSSSSVDQTIYGFKRFNETVYSNGNFNTTNSSSGTYASYGARTIALGTSSSPNIILNLPTTSGTHTLAIDDNVVHLNGTETITGAKTIKGSDLTFTNTTYD